MKKEDVDKMTVQEAMDYAVQKIVEQGKRCVGAQNSCWYADGQGNHCAIGWLLDEDDEFLMNSGGDIVSLCDVNPDFIPELILNNKDLFAQLQHFHDTDKVWKKRIGMSYLEAAGIDTSKPHWQQWLKMEFHDVERA